MQRNALFLAARSGRANVVKLLLHSGLINPNVPDSHGISPLLAAIQEGHEKVVRLLLQISEVKLNDTGRTGNIPTPLVAAASQGEARIVRMLLKRPDIDINRSTYGTSPIFAAAGNGHADIVSLLQCRPDISLFTPDHNGDTPLAHAAKHGHLAIAEALLAHPATNPHLGAQIGGIVGTPPLVHAAENNHLDMVQLLLQSGRVYPDAPDRYLRTPLVAAAEKGHTGVVRELFRLGGGDVDVEHMDMRRMTALRVAARNGHEGVVRFLVVEIGVRVDLGRRSGV
ncbi:hypothetical protein ASPNIDRAFT_173584, partial [Aspergillus niger ATCC 1015]